jgi:hypothetical protein
MTSISPQTLFLIVGALSWPFAVGLAVVLWSKRRAKLRENSLARVEVGVRQLYESLESQPVPPRLAVTVDALQEAEEMAAAKAEIRRRRRALAG